MIMRWATREDFDGISIKESDWVGTHGEQPYVCSSRRFRDIDQMRNYIRDLISAGSTVYVYITENPTLPAGSPEGLYCKYAAVPEIPVEVTTTPITPKVHKVPDGVELPPKPPATTIHLTPGDDDAPKPDPLCRD